MNPKLEKQLSQLHSAFSRLFDFLDARNDASHTYSQELADSVYSQLANFVVELDKLLENVKSASSAA